MELAVLGPVQVRVGGRAVDLGTPRQRAIVAALALAGGRVVPVDTLIARVWGDDPPAGALATLHGYVAALRRALEPDRPPRAVPRLLVTELDGYALRVDGPVDAVVLADRVAEARALLDVVPDHLRPWAAPEARGTVARAVDVLADAVALWRGEPYAEVGDDPVAVTERTRLRDLRAAATELRAVARLALGRHAEIVPELAATTATHPLHERWWALYAVALTRSGRQSEALTALQTLRALLADELGVDPSAPLRDLQVAILRQDPSVGWTDALERPPSDPAPQPRRRAEGRRPPPRPRWGLAGRRSELARLGGALSDVEDGRPLTVVVTGEAGVGKSRLVLEAARDAFDRGFTVALGQCSPDTPPPLWPWHTVATSLRDQLPDLPDAAPLLAGPPEDVRTWDAAATWLTGAAAAHPLLVVIEDVQWADRATLGLLVHVAAAARDERLAVVATLRQAPGAAVAPDTTAALARLGALRLDLVGLDLAGAAELVEVVAGSRHFPGDRRTLWERTRGNPFFLAEIVRADGLLQGALSEVVLARVATLPRPTAEGLHAAAVLGTDFELPLLAKVLGRSATETARLLDPALDAGVVVEQGEPAAYGFSHGVVREVLLEALPADQRTAWHGAVARALAGRTRLARPDQRAAVVHHWEQAGPAHAAEAWRAALGAAARAREDSAYAEEARYLGRALGWQALDEGSAERERFELLMMQADSCRWCGDWQGVSDAVDEAVSVAERLDDPELAARAAISTLEGALWQVRPFGQVHPPIVEALERLLHRLPPERQALRARAGLALATELYYTLDVARIDALVDEALSVAATSSDHRFRATAYLGAFVARSRPDTAEERVGYADAALRAALAADDPRSRLLAETLSVTVASELGDAATVRERLPQVVELTRARGMGTAEAVLRALEVPWRTMEGRPDDAAAALARLGELSRDLRMPNLEDAVTASILVRSLLSADYADQVEQLWEVLGSSTIPAGPAATVLALRAGEPELAARLHGQQGVDLTGRTFMSLINACLACEIALGLDLPELAAAAYPIALPYAGRMCSAGSASALGPVDAFLARGAAAVGDHTAAARHRAVASELARAWRLPRLVDDLALLADHYAR